MTEPRPNPAFGPAYEVLLELEERLGALRHGVQGVDPHGTAACTPSGSPPPSSSQPFPGSIRRERPGQGWGVRRPGCRGVLGEGELESFGEFGGLGTVVLAPGSSASNSSRTGTFFTS
ncbi:hypothetical protein ACFT5C_21375 [Streptomyces sp. NPDC057116]|uniref:hypothetical protein n=1 Tax=Streptomyces sp. NPDC057116 TaxID=3346023 RepID=UPI00362A770B